MDTDSYGHVRGGDGHVQDRKIMKLTNHSKKERKRQDCAGIQQ